MIGAAAFIATNVITWLLLTLSVPDLSWPIATILTLPFTFIVGQLAEGLMAWRSRLSPRDAAIRGGILSLVIAIVLTFTQFFGTLPVQASDLPYALTFAVILIVGGTTITVLSRMAPDAVRELFAAVRAERSLNQRSHREAVVAEVSVGGQAAQIAHVVQAAQGPVARQPIIPQPETAPKGPDPKERPVSHRSVWS